MYALYRVKASNGGGQNGEIASVFFNHFTKCNLKCVYCYARIAYEKLPDTNTQDVKKVIEYLFDNDLMVDAPRFIFGGGEPALYKDIEELTTYLISKGGIVRIFSNGTHFLHSLAEAAATGYLLLTITPDAGSREIYKALKGVDLFDRVWVNIAEYIKTAGWENIQVKFILQKGNLGDIDNMVNRCVESGVKKVMSAIDLNIHSDEYPDFSPHFARLSSLCRDKGLLYEQHFV